MIECGPRGALLFMSWLGIKVLPKEEIDTTIDSNSVQLVGSIKTDENIVVRKYIKYQIKIIKLLSSKINYNFY